MATQEEIDALVARAEKIQSVGGSLLSNATLLKEGLLALTPEEPTPDPDPDPTPDPEPDPDPEPTPDPEPDPEPGTITHGKDLPATSLAAASVIGPRGTLTPRGGGTLKDGEVIENAEINGLISIAAGAHVIIRNSRIIGTRGQTTYTIKHTAGGGSLLELEDCEVIGRTVDSSTPRCIAMFSDGNLSAKRTIFRGGIDNVYVSPVLSPGVISTGDPLVPKARVLFEECWFGDLQRVSGSHTDCLQIDGGGHVLVRRSRIMSYSIPVGADPLTARVNPETSDLGGGGLITTVNSSKMKVNDHIGVRDSWFEGGNITCDLGPPELADTNCEVTDNLFGLRHRYLPARGGSGVTMRNNLWGQTGTTPDRQNPISVVAGTPI